MSSQSISLEERWGHLEDHYADRVTVFRQRLAHLGLSRVLVVLLDIGKNVHWVTAFLASGLELLEPHRLPTTQTGLTQLLQMTDTLIAQHPPPLVLLGYEPTGVCHEPWARALMDYYAPNLAFRRCSKYAVSQVVGYIKGKSAIHIARNYMGRSRGLQRATLLGHRLLCINGWHR